jgi:hypothetical protein
VGGVIHTGSTRKVVEEAVGSGASIVIRVRES